MIKVAIKIDRGFLPRQDITDAEGMNMYEYEFEEHKHE